MKNGEEPAASGLPWDHGTALGWHDRARRLPRLVRGVHAAVGWARESTQLHPDRRRRAEYARMRPYYEETLRVLEETADHIFGLTHTLVEAAEERRDEEEGAPRHPPEPEVVDSYADFLHQVAAALDAYGRSVTDPQGAADAYAQMQQLVAQVRRQHRALRAELPRQAGPAPEQMALFGSLLARARGLTDPLLPTTRWPRSSAPGPEPARHGQQDRQHSDSR